MAVDSITLSESANGSLCIAHSGVRERTVQYIALRIIHETDVFPSSDFGLLRGIARDNDILGISALQVVSVPATPTLLDMVYPPVPRDPVDR